MKKIKILLVIGVLFSLASCTTPGKNPVSSLKDTGSMVKGEESKTMENSDSMVKDEESKTMENNNLTDNKKEVMKKTEVSAGDNIAVSYTGTLEDGTVFDATSKHDGKPLEFTAGAGQMIKGFDAGVIGMKLGETKKIEMEAKDAYGEYDEKRKEVVEKDKLESFIKAGYKLVKGERLPTQSGIFEIIEADEKTVTIDTNSPLAGKNLTFEVTIESIK